MKILFLYPNIRGMYMLPPSIALLSAILKREGFEIDLFDSTHWTMPGYEQFDSDKTKEKNLNVLPFDFEEHQVTHYDTDVFEDFEKKVQAFAPDLIAITATEDIFPVAISLLSRVRKYKIPTLLGGVFATFAPELALSYPEIDMVCVGEGEECIVDLCHRISKGQPYDDVTNLWLKKRDGSIIRNPMTKPVRMEDNPLLDIGIFEESRFYRPMQGKIWRMFPVETHRGCPYTCAFCNSPSQNVLYSQVSNSPFFRKKSFEAVREELVFYRDVWKAEFFYFWADTFFAYSDKEFDEFCDMYSDIKIPFWVQTRPETLSEYRVSRLKEVGLYRMAMGMEHGDEKFRREVVDRRWDNDKIIEAVAIPNRLGVPFSINNIVGFPTETRELAMQTVELNRQIQADNYNCYSFTPFHGTPLRRMAEQLGYIKYEDISRSLMSESILDMPQFPRSAVEGLRRCFVLYVKFPKERWPEIRQAEAMTPEGDAIWERLRQEFVDTYFTPTKVDDLDAERV